jgi:hypothetical protein
VTRSGHSFIASSGDFDVCASIVACVELHVELDCVVCTLAWRVSNSGSYLCARNFVMTDL